MLEPRVLGTGVDQVGHPELLDPSQPLKTGMIDDRQHPVIKGDMIVYRAADPFHGNHTFAASFTVLLLYEHTFLRNYK